ncbi:FadR/GntR family transcriptional regulator [Marinitenerispora sediminis]|uniref:GntR family transcriptional regulator n=1 Tax=Marinitenerispora sediminis TaxID=1931232 RepID=A0A368T3U9_9ACTN|nr:FadR/GntR family transcriptional regulator [Marinitenerispora sediminis]RCV54090.1 GntR family transcriptional regulator [Marinitenerispora sediminis]RCV56813.1 GntR family transcriptional regulator [Marinitenerispora sediminis]RCV56936.1 GntR family transcriptional regulator [Marinitenerispora sediminis]
MDLSDSRTAGRAPLPGRVSAMEAVLTDLRGAIERGDHAVGDKLPPEAELARHYGVSRSVIREALRAAQALGLTVPRTGKGTYVASNRPVENPRFGSYSARDLVEVRRHVEIPVAGYAAVRRSEDDLEVLARLIARMEVEQDDTAWVALDTQFHITIAEASGNPVFRKVIEEIRDALSRQSIFLNRLGNRREQSDQEHRAILRAIADGSRESAVEAMTTHLQRVESTLTTIVRPGRGGGTEDEGAA